MTHLRTLLLILVALAVVAAGCGGGDGDVPRNAVASIGDCGELPTPEYNTLKNQAVQYLVQRRTFECQAEDMDVEVSDQQVNARLDQIKKQYFQGDQKKYAAQLKQQGLTDESVRKDIRAQLVQEGIFKKVTEDIKVTDKQIADYYDKNKTQYGTPESREIRHILVPTKKQANQLYEQLQNGADFAALAKKFSKDPGSAAQGGKMTIAKGQTVQPFDQTAFLLGKGVISRPVQTQYGYHIIEPLSAVKPAKTTPLKDVKESIRQQLLQTKRNETMTKWVEETKSDYADKTDYQVGFAPPAAATATGAGATTSSG